jgi:hypothetical protein
VHCIVVMLAYDPPGHVSKQAERSVDTNLPVGHWAHTVADANEYCPIPHGTGSVASLVAQNEPCGQLVH